VELAAFVLKIVFASESEVILGVLRLIDLCTGNLIVIVIFSGFQVDPPKSGKILVTQRTGREMVRAFSRPYTT
jgi:hypothetical protein